MPPLRELQIRFMDAIARGAHEPAARDVAGPAERASSRLAIYQNTMRGNFADALRATFPAVARLVGEDYFRQSARELQRQRPSQSGDLVHVGKHFAEHLRHTRPHDGFAYLADVAQLEWLIQECLLAADHAPLDLESLAGVAPADYDELRFVLHPASRLFESPYPALRVWEVNLASEIPPIVRLDAGADRLLILRRHMQLQFLRLSPGEHAFLGAVARALGFAAAVECGLHAGGGFDATAALQRFVTEEAIVDYSTATP